MVQRNPETEQAVIAAREGARIAFFETKDYRLALNLFKHLVLYSKDEHERREAQKKIATIYYEHLADYQNAVAEFYRLLDLPHSPEEEFEDRFAIAKSQYFLNRFFQAQAELDALLKKDIPKDQMFDALMLKANIFLARKSMDNAIKTFQQVIAQFPERSKKEDVALNLAVCYEEQKKFNEAIQVLKGLRDSYPTPEFIDMRIKRLQERASYLPGARGLRK